ncbi:hypothetical protein [Nonomuraea rubra]
MPRDGLVTFDGAQHLVSAAAGELEQRPRLPATCMGPPPGQGQRPQITD